MLDASKVTLYLDGRPLGEVGSFKLVPASSPAPARDVPGFVEFSCELVSCGPSGRLHADMAEAMDYLTTNHATGQPVTRISSRGGGLIPDSAFSWRSTRAKQPQDATTEETEGVSRLQAGCYHRLPVRYEEPGDEE